MKNVRKQERLDCDATAAERDQFNATVRPPLKSQVMLSLKLFFIGGVLMLTLWLVDCVVTT